MDRDKIFGKTDENGYLWCMHCERTYKHGNFKQIMDQLTGEILQVCPYEDCDGDTVLDVQEWDSIRGTHPEYPKIPELEKVYPLN